MQNGFPHKTILIVDDEEINRVILKEMFDESYRVIEASDGVEALKLLRDNPAISFMILDLHMPRLDGLGVLEQMHLDPVLSKIPVIIDTSNNDIVSQRRALALGALDVITKPFDTTNVQLRVDRFVSLIDSSRIEEENKWLKELMHLSEIDAKTGLWNKETFCRETKKILLANPDKHYVIARWDIDRFKVFNDTFGTDAGDELIRKIGEQLLCLSKNSPGLCTIGYYDADHFVYCVEKFAINPETLFENAVKILSTAFPNYSFSIHFGFYDINDISLDVGVMCDRAMLALRSVKNDYTIHYAWYDEKMRTGIVEEQEISSTMKGALNDGQFVVFYQPQYNYETGEIIGAEALVRWKHPENGLIPPSTFIPVFEKNGFISELDRYIWDTVCRHLRDWRENGFIIPSVSVNVSRRDLYLPNLTDCLLSTVKKYELTPADLHLEITESAYVDNPDLLISTVYSLRDAGFKVEMDDFGSGYSSLNTLKDVHVDLLKMDMAFISQDTNRSRGGSILSSVVGMAHAIDLRVLAEGVETKQQADYLKSIGCLYMQGYFFSTPLSHDDFESVISKNTTDPDRVEYRPGVDNSVDFLDATTQSTLLFNSFVGGAGILEYRGGNIAALRLNDRFFEVLGVSREEYLRMQYNLADTIAKEDRDAFVSMFENAIKSGTESESEIKTVSLKKGAHPLYLRTMVRCLAKKFGSYIFYLSIENITKRVNYEKQNAVYGNIIRNLPVGVAVFEVGKKPSAIFLNDSVCAMFGYERDECTRYISRLASVCFTGSKNESARELYKRLLNGENLDISHINAIRADGSRFWMRAVMHSVSGEKGKTLIYASLIDMTDAVIAENNISEQRKEMSSLIANTPGGISRIARNGDSMCIEYISRGLCNMLGYDSNELFDILQNKHTNIIHPDDKECATHFDSLLTSGTPSADVDVRILRKNKKYIWLHITCNYVAQTQTQGVYYLAYSDISETRKLQNQTKQDKRQMETIINSIPGGVASYEVRPDCFILLYASDGVAAISGRSPKEYRSLMTENKGTGVYKNDEAEVVSAIQNAIISGEELDINFRIVHKDGSLVWVNLRGRRNGKHNGYPVLQAVFHNLSVATKLYREVIDKSESIINVFDCDSHEILFANRAAEKLSGISKESAVGMHCYEYIEKRDAVCDNCRLRSLGDSPISYEKVIDGRRYYMTLSRINWNGHNAFIAAMSDRTELYAYQEQLDTVLKNIPGGIAVFRITGGRAVRTFVSESAKALLGYRENETIDSSITINLSHIHPDDRKKLWSDITDAMHKMTVFNSDFRVKTSGGGYRWLNLLANPVEIDGSIFYYGIYSDAEKRIAETRKIREEQKIVLRAALDEAEESKRDAVTGIYSRVAAENLIESKLSEEQTDSCALVLLDMDNLKTINDSFGHLQGDRALKSVAETLQKHFRSTDIVGRYGGDELIVFMPGISNKESLFSSLRLLIRELSQIRIGEHNEHAIHCSVGCTFGKTGDSLNSLYKHADIALYHVKSNGKNGFALYTPEMESESFVLGKNSHSPHEQFSIGKNEFLRLTETVSSFYSFVLSINLSQNSYVFLKAESRHLEGVENDGIYSDLLYGILPFIREDERKVFLEKLSQKNLLSSYDSGQTSISLHMADFLGGDNSYVRSEIVALLYKNESGDICGFAFVRNSDKVPPRL